MARAEAEAEAFEWEFQSCRLRRFRALLADGRSSPGREHPLWAWLDPVPVTDPEATGWINIGFSNVPTIGAQFLAHKASALASLASLAEVVPPSLVDFGHEMLRLEDCLQDLARGPADDSDAQRAEDYIVRTLDYMQPFASRVATRYGINQAPDIYYGHPFYLVAVYGTLNAFLTAVEKFAPLSAAAISFALIWRLVDETESIGGHSLDPDVEEWLLERCDLGLAGAAIVSAIGLGYCRESGARDSRFWLASHWSLTPGVARQILDDLARPASDLPCVFNSGRRSAWALPTLEAEARLDLRFVWIGLVVAARPGPRA